MFMSVWAPSGMPPAPYDSIIQRGRIPGTKDPAIRGRLQLRNGCLRGIMSKIGKAEGCRRESDFGVIGLAVMGQNLALNIESKGFTVSVYNRTGSKTDEFYKRRAQGKRIVPAYTLEEFVASLKRPRKIMLMVKAGPAVDAMIDALLPLPRAGRHHHRRRQLAFRRHRPAREEEVEARPPFPRHRSQRRRGRSAARPFHHAGRPTGSLRHRHATSSPTIAAKPRTAPAAPTSARIAPATYVKMIHNGIEYGNMQIIAEAYDLMKRRLGIRCRRCTRRSPNGTQRELEVLPDRDHGRHFEPHRRKNRQPLVDMILDRAEPKGHRQVDFAKRSRPRHPRPHHYGSRRRPGAVELQRFAGGRRRSASASRGSRKRRTRPVFSPRCAPACISRSSPPTHKA